MDNQAGGMHRAIGAAIAEAAQELTTVAEEEVQLQAHLHRRQERATQLEQFITIGQRLWGNAPPGAASDERRANEGPSSAQESQPLTTSILEIVATAARPLTPAEVRTALAQRGKTPTKAVVSSTLSTLVKRQRLTRPAPGQYTALRRHD